MRVVEGELIELPHGLYQSGANASSPWMSVNHNNTGAKMAPDLLLGSDERTPRLLRRIEMVDHRMAPIWAGPRKRSLRSLLCPALGLLVALQAQSLINEKDENRCWPLQKASRFSST